MTIQQIGSFVPYDSNMYLLIGEKTMLIDTGSGTVSAPIVGYISEILYGRKLDYIVLTHHHYDHIGGLKDLVPVFGSEVLAGPTDVLKIRKGGHDGIFGVNIVPCPEAQEISEGMKIDLGRHLLEVIETPGHTEGGICLYDHNTSSLFSGDTVFADGVGRTDFEGGDIRQLRESLRKLKKYDVLNLYSGHGPVVEGKGNDSIIRGLRYIGE